MTITFTVKLSQISLQIKVDHEQSWKRAQLVCSRSMFPSPHASFEDPSPSLIGWSNSIGMWLSSTVTFSPPSNDYVKKKWLGHLESCLHLHHQSFWNAGNYVICFICWKYDEMWCKLKSILNWGLKYQKNSNFGASACIRFRYQTFAFLLSTDLFHSLSSSTVSSDIFNVRSGHRKFQKSRKSLVSKRLNYWTQWRLKSCGTNPLIAEGSLDLACNNFVLPLASD